MDADGYKSEYYLSDESYASLVTLIKNYIAEKGEENINPQDFNSYLYNSAPELYNLIDSETREEQTESAIENAQDWFDEEDEDCTIEEYIENTYSFGFYITKECLLSFV